MRAHVRVCVFDVEPVEICLLSRQKGIRSAAVCRLLTSLIIWNNNRQFHL